MKNKQYMATWAKAAGIRAVKTMAQTALSMITLGMAAEEITWQYVASVSVVAGVYSLLTSIAGLPEVEMEMEGNGDDSE